MTLLLALSLLAAGDRIVVVAGQGADPAGTTAATAKTVDVFGVDFGPDGNLFLVEMNGHRIARIDSKGGFAVVAGTGEKGFADGPAMKAQFAGIHNVAVGPDGAVYVSDTWNNRVRRFHPAKGVVTTFAGTGDKGFGGDGGPAREARMGPIYAISLSPDGATMHLADLHNRRIRAIDMKTGVITTAAGNGKRGRPKEGGVATEEPLVDPRAMAADSQGRLYVLERGGHALRVVENGRIRTVAGTGKKGLRGDGGPALEAELNGPKHICVDGEDNVIIADAENHVIRKYLPKTGAIVRVAGTGKKGKAGAGGSPLKVELNRPHGVTVGPDGKLYISDSWNHRLLRIDP